MFTIGEFSRLCCVSARMLRHYDSIGLLHPYLSGKENGYRYYDISQLPTIIKIEQLKLYDFTLEEIKHLLTLSDDNLRESYKDQLLILKAKRQHYDLLIHKLEQAAFHKEDSIMNDYHVLTMQQKPQNVLTITRTIPVCSSAFHSCSLELYKKLHEQRLTQTGPMQICYLDEEFNEEHATVELQVEVKEQGKDIKELPGMLCATTIHTGPMEKINKAYQAILAWLSEHDDYELCGPSFERLIKDEKMAASDQELETAVLFPIQKKESH